MLVPLARLNEQELTLTRPPVQTVTAARPGLGS